MTALLANFTQAAEDLGPSLGPILIAGFIAVLVIAMLIVGLRGRR